MAEKRTGIQQRLHRKKEIMDAGRKLFCANGIPKTTLVDIATEAGMTKATVQIYFETKELMLKAILEDLLNSLMLELEDLPHMKDSYDRFRIDLKEFIYNVFIKYKDRLKLLYGYNFIYTDINPAPPLKISHLIEGKEVKKVLSLEKKLKKAGIINSNLGDTIKLQVFMESLLGLAGELAGKGGILKHKNGISPRSYLDTMIDIFLDSILIKRQT